MYCHYIDWCSPLYRGVLYSECPLSEVPLGTCTCMHIPAAGTRELDRYGLSSVVEQEICHVDRHRMFESLFRAILEFRLKEDAFSRVRCHA